MSKQIRLLSFIVISFLCSFIFLQLQPVSFDITKVPYPLFLSVALLAPLGLLLMSLLLRPQLKLSNKISLFGNNPQWCVLLILLPIVCLTVVGIPNSKDIQPNLFGLFIGMLMMLYTFMEEYGWRGYLQEELQLSNEWARAIVIGVIWYAWHWSFLDTPDLLSNLVFLGAIIAGSLGIGKISDATRSIAVCAVVHSWGSIAFAFPLIANSVPLTARLIIIAINVVALMLVYKKWKPLEKSL